MKIDFQNVSFAYSKKDSLAIRNIDLSLKDNEIVFILGSTGSGKSTLIQHMNGLLYPQTGNVVIDCDGESFILSPKLKQIKNIRRNIGLVFQNPENQLFEKNVLSDVMYGPMNFGVAENDAKTVAIESLLLVGVDNKYFEKAPFDLSGGEKRKVAIAGILACKPKTFIFDEPTSNLDKRSTREFFALVNKLKDEGHMIIIISHDENLAYEYADRVMIMSNGEIIFNGGRTDAFKDNDLLKKANIEVPFVAKVKSELKIKDDIRTVKELAKIMRGDSL